MWDSCQTEREDAEDELNRLIEVCQAEAAAEAAMADDHESTESVQTEDDVEWERMEYVRCNRLPVDHLDGWSSDELKRLDDFLRDNAETCRRMNAERRALKAMAKAKQMPTPIKTPSPPMPKPKQTPTMPKKDQIRRALDRDRCLEPTAKPKQMPKSEPKRQQITVVEPGDLNWSVCTRCTVFRPFALIAHPTCSSLLGVECTYDDSDGEAQQPQPASSSEGWCPLRVVADAVVGMRARGSIDEWCPACGSYTKESGKGNGCLCDDETVKIKKHQQRMHRAETEAVLRFEMHQNPEWRQEML